MVLKPSDNLADFASRYYRLAKETCVDTGKAVRRLKAAVQQCAPTLASQIDFDAAAGKRGEPGQSHCIC